MEVEKSVNTETANKSWHEKCQLANNVLSVYNSKPETMMKGISKKAWYPVESEIGWLSTKSIPEMQDFSAGFANCGSCRSILRRPECTSSERKGNIRSRLVSWFHDSHLFLTSSDNSFVFFHFLMTEYYF